MFFLRDPHGVRIGKFEGRNDYMQALIDWGEAVLKPEDFEVWVEDETGKKIARGRFVFKIESEEAGYVLSDVRDGDLCRVDAGGVPAGDSDGADEQGSAGLTAEPTESTPPAGAVPRGDRRTVEREPTEDKQ